MENNEIAFGCVGKNICARTFRRNFSIAACSFAWGDFNMIKMK
jgi:hypothetical protein